MSYLSYDSTKDKIKKSWDKTVVNENNLITLIKKQQKVPINKTFYINQYKKRIEAIIRTGFLTVYNNSREYYYLREIIDLSYLPIGLIPSIKVSVITESPTGVYLNTLQKNIIFQQNSSTIDSKKGYSLIIIQHFIYSISECDLSVITDSLGNYISNQIKYTVRVDLCNQYMKNSSINQTV